MQLLLPLLALCLASCASIDFDYPRVDSTYIPGTGDTYLGKQAIDLYNAGNGVPRHALHLATSEPLRKTVEDVKLSTMPLSIIYHPNKGEPWAQADLVFFETPNGGAMFSTGSITWISSTLENNFNNDVATVTRNVIRRFIDKTPFPNPAAADVGRPDRAPRNPEYDVPIPPRD